MPSESPEVTVLIPAYNRKHLLSKAIESVLNQTYQDYELIVLDDGSTDGTAEWMAENYPSVKLVRSETNLGAAEIRNQGIKLARGKFIAFLDSDDRWKPNCLELQIKNLKENPDAVLSYCDYIEILPDGREYTYDYKFPKNYPTMRNFLMDTVIRSMSLVVASKEAIVQAGGLSKNLKISHDRELYLRMLYFGKVIKTPERLVFYVMHGGNLITNYKRWAKEVMMVLDLFFADERSDPYKYLEPEARSNWNLKLAKLIWQSKRDVPFCLTMLFWSFWFAPIYRIKRIGKRLIEKK
ncbi:glycosyltransferase family 2 protein [Phormidium sp. LEGE 05292]|uniref:glycosyltransferase family 2 protein n=1 Tax=[Phormidium] sp. LEGE 05292 TaxID=767427 RepID=UPI0018826184|nr:glycosyltransferase family 2 protein [Phormidium sp. LEGE 05292]MBE9228367.1 glycosyltransferase family 2 protein [Phormidium sp. LEGE 05292]